MHCNKLSGFPFSYMLSRIVNQFYCILNGRNKSVGPEDTLLGVLIFSYISWEIMADNSA